MSNTLLKRLGPLRSDEMASNGAQTLTTLDAVLGGRSRGCQKWAQTWPYFHLRVLWGALKEGTLATAIVLMHNMTGSKGSRRLGSSYVPKCVSGAPLQRPLEGLFTTIFIYVKVFYRRFLLQPASQLWYGAGDSVRHSRGATVVPPDSTYLSHFGGCFITP